ncbi:MAG: PAS domain-containing protein [Myxococcota bacterium]|nr:PAS domain-containing protein [Myxococcota bacterium]MDP6243232.1 PAS domain-containing protein [Myxococcota bacterium]MDP7074477.1 PAS domain-containing protein [Myxococcota bacterium]MDP7301373.1 PAS domain-containing protein [Myxococcota bacterium]MDP7434572.1 PAS domain-containing protein [Myxococcota bacterium]
MTRNPQLAAWLIARRALIDSVLAAKLGPAAPRAGAEETEVLRRFRSFAAAALQHGEAAQPALDGLRANDRRVAALLAAWVDAAAEASGTSGDGVRKALRPLLTRFQGSLKTTTASRRKRGTTRTRRAVIAAIDRVADAFLAVDAENARVVDANPAAGALLGVARDALLGLDAMSFVPVPVRNDWWTELDAVTENAEPRRFLGQLQDSQGSAIDVECSVTRFATRQRTLALIVARPTA